MGGRGSSIGSSKGGNISKAEKDAIFNYTTSSYTRINEKLRSGGKMSAKDQKTTESVSSAISKSTLKAGSTLYRGTSPAALGISKDIKKMSANDVKSLVGKTVGDKGFVSTSKSKDSASIFSGRGKQKGNVMMVIKNKTNKKGLDVGSNSNFGDKEHEVILPKGSKFKVIGAKRRLGNLVVEVEIQ